MIASQQMRQVGKIISLMCLKHQKGSNSLNTIKGVESGTMHDTLQCI